MKRLAVVGILLWSLAVAGCLGGPRIGTETEAPTPTEPGEAPTESATPTTPRTDGGNDSVEYVVRPGSIADGIAHLYVDFAVYLSEHSEDIHPCTDDAPLQDNKYDPTPTPLPMPAGQCERFDVPEIDFATLDGTRSLGRFDASATYSGAHTLVVHDVTVVLENGTTASDVYDTDFRAVTEPATPSGAYGVEIGVTDYEGSDTSLRWRFGVDVERFDPTED